MNRKLIIALVLILVVSFFLEAASPAFWVVRLTVRNNTYSNVYIKLESSSAYYYLTVKPDNDVKEFTVKTNTYKATFWGCGEKKVIKKLAITQQLRINFPACNAASRSSDGKIVGKVLRIVFKHNN